MANEGLFPSALPRLGVLRGKAERQWRGVDRLKAGVACTRLLRTA